MRPAPRQPRSTQPNVGRSDAAEGRALSNDLPPPTGAVQPHGSAVPLPHGGGGSLCPVSLLDAAAAPTSCIPLLTAAGRSVKVSPCPTGLSPYLDAHMTLWVSRRKVCPDCGVTFDRWNPGCGGVRGDGARYGASYCRACSSKRTLRSFRIVVDAAKCHTCGETFCITRAMRYQKRYGFRSLRYCSPACRDVATRVYTSKTEKAREKKRRYRARLRAAGRKVK